MKHQSAGPAYADRARAALLAHACGDRFGAPLEFVSDAGVRTRTGVLGNWTDDTHMSLYLGEPILAHGPGPLRPDLFGQAVGEAFVRWLHDPLMPSTAPGAPACPGLGGSSAGATGGASGSRSPTAAGPSCASAPWPWPFAARICWRLRVSRPC